MQQIEPKSDKGELADGRTFDRHAGSELEVVDGVAALEDLEKLGLATAAPMMGKIVVRWQGLNGALTNRS